MRDLRGACQRNSSFGRGKHRVRLAIKRSTGRARTHSVMEKRPICWKLRLSRIKEAGSPNEAQQNSKPQLRIPERFPAKSSNFHHKSANFSFPVFSQETQFFTGGLILPIFHAKMVVSRLGPGYKNCHQSEKEENQTFEPAKVILSPSQPAVAG